MRPRRAAAGREGGQAPEFRCRYCGQVAAAGGLIEFRDCVVENTEGYGIKVQDKSADRARVRFVNCALRNVATNRSYDGAWTPIWRHLFKPATTMKLGGIDFVNCVVDDNRGRPAIMLQGTESDPGVCHITGTIAVRNPHGVKIDLGHKLSGVTLAVKEPRG